MSAEGNNEKRLTDMNHGRLLSVAWNAIQPFLTNQRTAALAELTNGYRTNADAHTLHFRIAKLAVIEDLETEIKATILRGERASTAMSKGNDL
jgi:hypothetical protein